MTALDRGEKRRGGKREGENATRECINIMARGNSAHVVLQTFVRKRQSYRDRCIASFWEKAYERATEIDRLALKMIGKRVLGKRAHNAIRDSLYEPLYEPQPLVGAAGETTSVSSFIPSNAINQKRAGWISLVSRRRRFLVIDDEASFDERLGWPRRWKRYSVISRSPVTTARDRRINGLLTNHANAG